MAAQAPASAHASLIDTDPAEGAVVAQAPQRATLTFDEPIQLPANGVHVFDATGTALTSSARAVDAVVTVELPAPMAQGTYVVAWRVVSADGHPIAGALTFSVGTPSQTVLASGLGSTQNGPLSAAAVVLQGAQYIGVFLVVGFSWMLGWLLPASAPADVRRTLRRWTWLSALTAWGSGLFLVPIRSLATQGLAVTSLFTIVDWFTELAAHEWQALCCLTAGLLLLLIPDLWAIRSTVTQVLGGVLALVSLILVGHTRVIDPLALVAVSDLVHVTVGAVWLGALAGLALAWRRLDPAQAVIALARFSVLAAWVVIAMGVTGTLLAWRILDSFQALVDTPFGVALLVKLMTVGVVLVLASYNRFALLPRSQADKAQSSARLGRVVAIEAGCLVTVLLVTGFLVQQSPISEARMSESELDDRTRTAVSGDVRAYVAVEPGAIGRNEVLLQIQGIAGDPLSPTPSRPSPRR